MKKHRNFLAFACLIAFSGLFLKALTADIKRPDTVSDSPYITWLSDKLDVVLKTAKENNKYVLLYLYTYNCSYCGYMDEHILIDSEVADYINTHFMAIRLESSTLDKTVPNRRFHTDGYPLFILLRTDGTEIERFKGKYERDEFLKLFKNVEQNIGTLDYYMNKHALSPENPRFLLDIILKYSERNDIENLLFYSNLLKKDFPDYYSSNIRIILGNIQNVYYIIGEYTSAAETSLQILDKVLYKEVRQHYDFAAMCFKNSGSFGQALQMYYNILLLFPEDILAYIDFIQTARISGMQLDLALEEGIKGLMLSAPETYKAELIFNLAFVYEKKGMLSRALEMAGNAFKMDPKIHYRQYKQELENKIHNESVDKEKNSHKQHLLFSHTEWDFDTIPGGMNIAMDLYIENRLLKPADINIVCTCDCIGAVPSSLVIEAGQTQVVRLTYNSSADKGKVEHSFIIKSKSLETGQKILRVFGIVE